MLSVKILYMLLLIISVIFYLLYTEMLSLYILIFLVALPLLLGAIIIYSRFFIKGSIEAKSNTVVKKGKIDILLSINNKTIIPFSNSIITIEYFNNLLKSYDTMILTVPIHPLCNERINFSLTSDYCGILNIKIKSIQIYDFIKLFSCRIKSDVVNKITVLPEIYNLNSLYKLNIINTNESSIFSKYKRGDDPSEIFDLKNYLQGDKPNRIHWNLSLKQDNLIVRHYSQPVNSSILVALDFNGIASEKNIRSLDTVSEVFASISFLLIDNEIPFKLTFYNSHKNSNESVRVINKSDVSENIRSIFENGPSDDSVLTKEISEKAYDFSKIVYISSSAENISELYNQSNQNMTLIYIKNEFSNDFAEFENSDHIIIIPAGKLEENISKLVI